MISALDSTPNGSREKEGIVERAAKRNVTVVSQQTSVRRNKVSSEAVLADGKVGPQGPSPAFKRLGQILLEQGELDEADIEQIIILQSQVDLSFGEAAIHLGLIDEEDLLWALAEQFNYHYFPTSFATGNRLNPVELVAAFDPFGARADAFRALRTQLVLSCRKHKRNTIPVVSPAHGDGRSYVAANLAVVFSQLELETILVDADFNNPQQHAFFGQSNATGLSSILAGHADWTQMSNLSVLPHLSVLPSGPVPPNRQELVESRRFSALLNGLESCYEYVVIDTPPACESTTAQTMAQRAGGALVLARKDRTRARDLSAVKEMVERAGCQILGAVFNQR